MAGKKLLITGSAGHLGEALIRSYQEDGVDVVGLDIVASPFTTFVGDLSDREFVHTAMEGITGIVHTATLHKPHVDTHSKQHFVATNVSGTLNLLEEAVQSGKVESFVYTSTTSVYGDALVPPKGEPAAWITEEAQLIPKNIYGVTKSAAEDMCQLFYRDYKLPCIVLRTSRFFPEGDDNQAVRETYDDENVKVIEFLYRRVDIEDVVSAHKLAVEKAKQIGFRKYIISATTPFSPDDLKELHTDAASVLKKYFPAYEAEFSRRNWKMFPVLDRVYVNRRARTELGWQPKYDFDFHLRRLTENKEDLRSPMAVLIGMKGYHKDN